MSEATGIEVGPEAFVGMLEGKNIGKSVLRIWPDLDEDRASERDRKTTYHRIHM